MSVERENRRSLDKRISTFLLEEFTPRASKSCRTCRAIISCQPNTIDVINARLVFLSFPVLLFHFTRLGAERESVHEVAGACGCGPAVID